MFLRVGHRGASAYEVENTLGSFQKAIELNANAVELDVRQSRDGYLVVIHDDNLKRVFRRHIRVKEATLEELKELSGNRLPTLEEALDFIDGKVEKILVELKEAGYEGKVLEIVQRARVSDKVILSSFHEEALSRLRALDEAVETGLICARHRNPLATAVKLSAQYLLPSYRFTHKKTVEEAHRHNIKVIVWTINTEEEAIEYLAKGVDGIASDKPDILNTSALPRVSPFKQQ